MSMGVFLYHHILRTVYDQMVKAFLPSMLERDHGHIAATSSFTGVAAMPMISCYSSSKYGVMGKCTELYYSWNRITAALLCNQLSDHGKRILLAHIIISNYNPL